MKKIFMLVCFGFYSIQIFGQSVIPPGAKLEKIAEGFQQPEGPVWNDSLGLLFSDIKANKIYRWSPADSSVSVYRFPSDSSNGLTYDKEGRLISTQMLKRRIVRIENDGTVTPLAETFRGKKFNSPNDVVVKSDGSIFFTDPDFNLPVGGAHELFIGGSTTQYLKGIYRIGPAGNITLLDSSFDKPNGICFSPDEKKLYVNESPKCSIYVWDVVDDSLITNKRFFYKIPVNGYSDGMKADAEGNIYCTGPTGVEIISPSGVMIGRISGFTGSTSNCSWGDADRKTLYITGGNAIYRIRLAEANGVNDEGYLPSSPELYPGYPNPFNPVTTIRYKLTGAGMANIQICDLLGNKVTTLVNEEKEPGSYEVVFDASRLCSGTYICRLTTGGFTKSQKIVLLK